VGDGGTLVYVHILYFHYVLLVIEPSDALEKGYLLVPNLYLVSSKQMIVRICRVFDFSAGSASQEYDLLSTFPASVICPLYQKDSHLVEFFAFSGGYRYY